MDVVLHPHEADRLAALESYQVLDSAPTHDFDALTRLAALICDAPMAMISLIDSDRQWFLGRFGTEVTQTPRTESVCSDSVAAGAPLVVPDLSQVTRYADLRSVTGPPGQRGYAGVPLIGRDGLPLGVLCVVDTVARAFHAEQLSALSDLARQAVTALELRRSDATAGLNSPRIVAEAREPTTLRKALENGEFVPHYQPLVDLQDGTVCGLEALMRWHHPTLGVLTPDAFLPVLELGRLADWTGQAMLESACGVLVDLRERAIGLPDGVAVNVSGHQLTTPGLAQGILDTLVRYDLAGAGLTVEVTEAAEVSDVAIARDELVRLRDAGVRVVADDFGVGWSNLVRLLQLPLSGLKIDKELVTAMIGDRVREHMVASAISLATTMGLDVIAEGVETEDVRDRLVEMGCHRGQGWLFSKAVPAAELPQLLTRTFPARSREPARVGADARPVDAPRPVGAIGAAADSFAGALLDAMPDSTAIVDRTGTIIAVNRAWQMFTMDNGGHPDSTGVGVNYLDVCARAAAAGSADALDVLIGLKAVLGGDTVESDREYPCPSPAAGRWFTSRITPLAGPTGGAVVSHLNNSRRKMSEQELLHQASHDPLTGLANRMLFTDRLTAALTQRPGRAAVPDVGLLYLDLDRFKPVNDLYGHSAGDEVLLTVAHRLRSNVRPQDTVARLGGDEFAICAPHVDAETLTAMSGRLRAALAEPHRVHGEHVSVPGSIGAYLAAAGETVTRSLELADEAMYAVKAARRT